MENAAPASLLAQSRLPNTNAASLYTAVYKTEITAIYIANNTGSGVAYRVHHDQAGTTYDESNALYFDVTLASNTTTVITNGEIGTNITIEPTDSIGIRSATGDALTFSLYGIVAAAR